MLCLYTHLKVALGAVGHYLAQQLRELCRMLGLFIGSLLPVQADLGITLAVSYAGHSQIHTDFTAFAVEVGAQALDDLGVNALGDAYHMLGGPTHLVLLHRHELVLWSLADGAEFGGLRSFVYITANCATELHINNTS